MINMDLYEELGPLVTFENPKQPQYDLALVVCRLCR